MKLRQRRRRGDHCAPQPEQRIDDQLLDLINRAEWTKFAIAGLQPPRRPAAADDGDGAASRGRPDATENADRSPGKPSREPR